MPGVGRLVAETETQRLAGRVLTEENSCVWPVRRDLVPRVDALIAAGGRGALRVSSAVESRPKKPTHPMPTGRASHPS